VKVNLITYNEITGANLNRHTFEALCEKLQRIAVFNKFYLSEDLRDACTSQLVNFTAYFRPDIMEVQFIKNPSQAAPAENTVLLPRGKDGLTFEQRKAMKLTSECFRTDPFTLRNVEFVGCRPIGNRLKGSVVLNKDKKWCITVDVTGLVTASLDDKWKRLEVLRRPVGPEQILVVRIRRSPMFPYNNGEDSVHNMETCEFVTRFSAPQFIDMDTPMKDIFVESSFRCGILKFWIPQQLDR